MKNGPHWDGRPVTRRAAFAIVAVLCAAAPFGTTVRAEELTKIRVANFTNTVVVPMFYALDKGYFKEAGLDVEIVKVATGAASVSAVAADQADIGWSATTVPIFARSNGVPVKAFMTADQEGPPDHYGTFLDASARSGVNSFAELKGKTVAINAYGTATELAIRDRLQKAGVAWDDVKKVIVPFPQMPAVLELGNADVVVTIQPMHGAIMANKAIGAKVLDRGTLSDSHTKVATASCYFATDQWLAKNEKAALAFGHVFLRAQKELHDNPEARLALVMKIGGINHDIATSIPESWFEKLAVTTEAVTPAIETLERTGMMQKKIAVEDVVATLPY